MNMKKFVARHLLAACYLLLATCYLLFATYSLAPRVIIKNAATGDEILSFKMYLGDTFATSYIHSVQLCEVRDIYCVSGGKLWLWEEQTGSTGAGLPFDAPERGVFFHRHEPDLYRYIGGGRSFRSGELLLRVGTNEIGRNTIYLSDTRDGQTLELFRHYPDELLSFYVDSW